MSDSNVTENPSSEAQHPRKKSPSRMRRWLIVVLALVLLVVAAQQLWALKVWEGLNKQEVAVDTVESRLATLEAALGSQANFRQEIDSLRQSLQQERSLMQLDRIQERIDAGWQIWLATGESKSLEAALKSGQSVLASEPSASSQTLSLAMSRDLTEIKSQHMTDLRETVEALDGVIASVDKLPLIQDRRLPSDEPEAKIVPNEPPAETLMEKARIVLAQLADELWQSIRGMIRVQRLDRAETALIAPEQKIFLQQGLRLLLLDARHALVQRNTATYQQTLSQARAWIEKYCDTGNALVKTDLSILQRLATLNIDPTAVSLEATRNALSTARAALLGESASANEEAAPLPATETQSADLTKPKGAAE